MKIAIIGGGFYGLHLADEILKKKNNVNIDIFEKENALFSGAFTNNQHRLHLGYHYPRSKDTIVQSVYNYGKFYKLYSDFIKIPKYNIYCIHKDSRVNFEEYCSIFNDFKLEFKKINNKELSSIAYNDLNLNNITNSIITKEGTVDFFGISDFLNYKLKDKINIFLNKHVEELPSGYDITINATYNYPNLFLKEKTKIKHELCCILLGENILNKDIGITIMDGEFCSIFPKTYNTHSISSVSFTPFLKYNDSEKKYSKKDIIDIYLDLNVKNKILIHANEYLKIPFEKITGEMLSIKTKFSEDLGDTREAIWEKEGSHYSIFCGKISAICTISEEIINDIGI
jgi:hypothetical protein